MASPFARCSGVPRKVRTLKPANFISKQVVVSSVFFLDEGNSDFQVRCGGFERCQPDYRIDRNDFPWYVMEFVDDGCGKVEFDGNVEPLRPGNFFLYGPGVPHRIATDPAKPLLKYFVSFSGSEAAALLTDYELPLGKVLHCLQPEPIWRAFEALIDRGLRNSKYSASVCAAITRQLLLMCREDAVDAGSSETRPFATFSRVKDVIERGYLEYQTLEAIATACELDGPYVCRLFARFHNESPYQFLTRLRMRYAARLLLEDHTSVKAAATACGFLDPLHFSRVFKSVHRIAPSRFHEAMRSKLSD